MDESDLHQIIFNKLSDENNGNGPDDNRFFVDLYQSPSNGAMALLDFQIIVSQKPELDSQGNEIVNRSNQAVFFTLYHAHGPIPTDHLYPSMENGTEIFPIADDDNELLVGGIAGPSEQIGGITYFGSVLVNTGDVIRLTGRYTQNRMNNVCQILGYLKFFINEIPS